MNREQLSVTIITLNEEKNIRKCLESVKWADEIIVVDSGSSDRTVEIAREYTDKVYHNPWPGHKEQKNFAISKSSHAWIFSIDADERVTETLRDFILRELESPGHDAYRFPRKNYLLGKWVRHCGWYPDHVLRLFRKDMGMFGGENPHDRVIMRSGTVYTSDAPFIHHAYDSLSQYVLKINFYSGIKAERLMRSGKSTFFLPVYSPFKILVKFFEIYIIKLGFLDGYRGVIIAALSAFSTYLKYSKIWELEQKRQHNTPH